MMIQSLVLVAALGPFAAWSWGVLILLYLDPGSMMPLGTGLAAIIGILLIFWQRVVRFVRTLLPSSRKSELPSDASSSSDGDAQR